MSIELSDIKAYLRINHDVDDSYIGELVEVAKSFIKEQTGVAYSDNDKVYRQGVLFLVAHLYDNRSAVEEKTVNIVPYTLDAIIKHIRLRGELEDNGGENEQQ
ncbi:MAG: phage gp6-like head-tail connector protein, partial [Bacteroidales bacterium]|nr:phage gp6-like head-tail connector protein [Bacteroidales bacterium]